MLIFFMIGLFGKCPKRRLVDVRLVWRGCFRAAASRLVYLAVGCVPSLLRASDINTRVGPRSLHLKIRNAHRLKSSTICTVRGPHPKLLHVRTFWIWGFWIRDSQLVPSMQIFQNLNLKCSSPGISDKGYLTCAKFLESFHRTCLVKIQRKLKKFFFFNSAIIP